MESGSETSQIILSYQILFVAPPYFCYSLRYETNFLYCNSFCDMTPLGLINEVIILLCFYRQG